MSEEEKRSMQQPTEEEESGDDDDMGKYMIDDDDDDLPTPVPKKDKSEKKIDTEDQKKELFSAKELRDVSSMNIPLSLQ